MIPRSLLREQRERGGRVWKSSILASASSWSGLSEPYTRYNAVSRRRRIRRSRSPSRPSTHRRRSPAQIARPTTRKEHLHELVHIPPAICILRGPHALHASSPPTLPRAIVIKHHAGLFRKLSLASRSGFGSDVLTSTGTSLSPRCHVSCA